MSNLTTIYDKIRATLPTLTGFSDKTEIPYPYDLQQNDVNFIRNGWGLKIGSSTPQTATDNRQYTITTEIEVVLTERVARTSSNADPLVEITKNILNDISVLENDFTYTPHTTSTRFSSTDKITYVDVVSRSGIENVTSGKFNHITTSIIFGITHWN